jgi:RHS repeat-associated protein
MKSQACLLSLLLVLCNQTFGQSCHTPTVKEPEKVTFNRKVVNSYLVGQEEFQETGDCMTHYRKINYSGSWNVANHDVAWTCSQVLDKEDIGVSIGGSSSYSKIDGSLVEAGFAQQVGCNIFGALPAVGLSTTTNYNYKPTFQNTSGAYIKLYVSPFDLTSETATERFYSMPVQNHCGWYIIGTPSLGPDRLYGINLFGSTKISLSEPDTFEDAVAHAETRGGSVGYDSAGEAYSTVVSRYGRKEVDAASVDVEALFRGCAESRWEVEMILVEENLSDNTTSEYRERQSIRMDQNGEYVFKHKLVAEGCFTKVWIKSLFATEQPACEGFGENGRLGSIHWSASLGGNRDGESSGAIRIDAEDMADLTFTSGDLKLSHRGEETNVVFDVEEALRQIITPTTIADVITLSATSYEVKLYTRDLSWTPDAQSGIYPVVGSPFVAYTISQQLIVAEERLRIATSRGGNSEYREYGFSESTSNETWTMWEGSGAKRTSIVEDLNYDSSPHSFVFGLSNVTSKTTSVYDAADDLVSKVERVYEVQTLGSGISQYALSASSLHSGPSNTFEHEVLRIEHFFRESEATPAHEISYTYGTDPAANNYNRLTLREDSRGPWKKWTYHTDGTIHTEESGYLNSAPGSPTTDNQLLTHTYTTVFDIDGDGVDEDLKISSLQILGNAVEISYQLALTATITSGGYTLKEIRQITGHTPTVDWDASGNLVNKRWIHESNDLAIDGDEYARLNSDITAVITKRVLNNDGTATKTIYRGPAVLQNGVPNSISAGTITTEEIAISGTTLSEETVDIASGLVVSSTLYTDFDDEHRAGTLIFLDGTQEQRIYSCCGLQQVTLRDGLVTYYEYDSLGRIEYTTTAMGTAYQQVVRNAMSPEGNVTAVYQGPDSSSMDLVAEMEYGLDGTLLEARDRYLDAAPSASRPTSMAYSMDGNSRQVTTTTYPNGSTRVETFYDDDRLYQVTGSAGRGAGYTYGVEVDADLGYPVQTRTTVRLDEADAETGSYEKIYTDAPGRTYKVETPAADGGTAITRYTYNALNQLKQVEDPDGVSTLYAYNSEGEREITALDANGDDIIDYDGTDRITRTRSSFTTRAEDSDNYTVQRQTTEVWEVDSADSAEVIATADRSLGALSGNNVGTVIWSTFYGQTTKTESLIDHASATVTTTTTLPDTSYQIDITVDGLLESSTRHHGDDSILSKQTYNYDTSDENRLESVTDLYNGTTQYTYYGDGQLESATTPDPDTAQTGTGYDPQVTAYTYTDDATSISRTTTLPDLTTATEIFYPTGELKEASGSQTYPVAYTYDYAGRLLSQTTWQDKPADTGKVLTAWEYYANGQLKKKWYEATIAGDGTISGTAGPSYAYTDAGRLRTRTNARDTVTTYAYTPDTHDLSSVTYDDGVTPAVSYPQYDRQGRAQQIIDASGTRDLSYENGQHMDEDYIAGTLSDYAIDRRHDGLNRMDQLTLTNGLTELHQVDYGYDSASRLNTVTHRGQVVTYTYDPSTELRETRTFNNGSSDVLTAEHRYDHLNRLRSITNLNASFLTLNSHSYQYNDLNQRERMTLVDNSYWQYGYDDLGQIESAVQKDASDTLFSGRNFGFTFDDIGNRTQANANGRTAIYTPNELNQYDERAVPRALDVGGSALAGSTVTVNTNTATRQGEYFHHALDLSAQGNSAQQVELNVTATLPDGGDNNTPRIADAEKSQYLPPNPEDFAHDADGNLTQEGQWSYTWDAENRLIEMETLAIAYSAGAPRQKLEFAYDSQSRRFSKKVYDWDTPSSAYLLSSSYLYLYDDWNLITTLKVQGSTFDVQSSYVWGTDLSGSLQGAGGVGGLLAVIDETGSTAYPSYDGNGNVMGYYAADTGESIAEFEYGPFGELIRATGEKKDDFNFRFSTKYEDTETGLLYYGFRYYDATTGRWPNRDPIEETGGLNLNAMVGNDLVNFFDLLGLTAEECQKYVIGTCERSLAGRYVNLPSSFKVGIREVKIRESVRARVERHLNEDLGHHDVGFLRVDENGNQEVDLTLGFFADDFKEAGIGALKELASHLVFWETSWDNAGWVPGTIKRSTNPGPCSADKEVTKEEYERSKSNAESMIGRYRAYHLYKSNCQDFASEF